MLVYHARLLQNSKTENLISTEAAYHAYLAKSIVILWLLLVHKEIFEHS